MLSLILWILFGIVALTVLYYIAIFVFTLLGLKKILGWATGEVNQLPQDYAKLRKGVKNKNSRSSSFETFIKEVFVRWYHKLFK